MPSEKTCIQIGLQYWCEYRFLAEPEYENRRYFTPINVPLLPPYFDTSGDWFYHGIDADIRCFPSPLRGRASQIHERTITHSVGDRLQDFCAEQKIEHIDLLAIDIEGWEHRVLPTLRDAPPIEHLIIEFHPSETIDEWFRKNPSIKAKFEKDLEDRMDIETFLSVAEEIGFTLYRQFPTHYGDTIELWMQGKTC